MIDETMDNTSRTEQHTREELESKLKEKTSQIIISNFQVGYLITDIAGQNLKITEQSDKIIQLEEKKL